jgi:hypothetical protein
MLSGSSTRRLVAAQQLPEAHQATKSGQEVGLGLWLRFSGFPSARLGTLRSPSARLGTLRYRGSSGGKTLPPRLSHLSFQGAVPCVTGALELLRADL